jgi:hypothetical protein
VSAAPPELSAERIAEQGRAALHGRLRAAFERQLAARPPSFTVGEAQVEDLVDTAAGRADAVLWRRCLAGVAADALGIGLAEAVSHPEVLRAHALVGAPPYEEIEVAPAQAASAGPAGAEVEAATDTGALRVAAVHLGGIESLRQGESDLELRFSAAGLDVLKASSGAAIGRLGWTEIENISFPRARRGLRASRRRELHVQTARGRATFELPGLSDRQLQEELEPLLARWRPADP